ncbi:MAG TPA: polysaccharide pyruvyl transferase family protein [Pseudolysinimonas sp.]|nr:polysaccharide pyruvyl transferase family protein [Pseudolysinimonas sp.]
MTNANLLYDSVSQNTGDIAIGIAATQVFERFGVSARVVSPFNDHMPSPLVIGGGELIRDPGDSFYDAFRQTGPHILNAAGVWHNASELDYLNEYAFVSARSTRELGVLQKVVPSAELLPCATTLLTSPDYEIPGVDPGEPLVGIHLVPHSLRMIDDLVPLIDAIPYRKVIIPFTHYNGDASFMSQLPFRKSDTISIGALDPLQLHAVIRRMKYVVVTSLHASIFAYSQNVPFVSIHQKKVENYFTDRGLLDHLASDHASLATAIRRVDEDAPDFTALVQADADAVLSAFERYARILGSAPESAGVASESVRGRTDALMLAQAAHVIQDRDLAIAYAESRRLALAAKVAGQTARLSELEKVLRRYHNAPWRRGRRFMARALRYVRRRFLRNARPAKPAPRRA